MKSENGQHLGQRNSGHHHMVSIALHVLSVFTQYVVCMHDRVSESSCENDCMTVHPLTS